MARLRHIANLWTLMGHPLRAAEWTLEEKLAAIKAAGFDGVCWGASEELCAGLRRHGLMFVGGIGAGDTAFAVRLRELKACGAEHVNVQLATDAVTEGEALRLTLKLMAEARALSLQPAIETHRGTATETPEKMYALADGYAQATGELLPVSWDFSHFAVVKHLLPSEYAERLLLRPEMVRAAQQFHFRPFTGHHAQVAITDARGELTQEVKDWIPFAEAVMGCWLETNSASEREMFVCPELGPIEGGYALSTFPSSWEDAKVLRGVIDKMWKKLTD